MRVQCICSNVNLKRRGDVIQKSLKQSKTLQENSKFGRIKTRAGAHKTVDSNVFSKSPEYRSRGQRHGRISADIISGFG